jgi:MYXO-CTERM domain-containing protein
MHAGGRRPLSSWVWPSRLVAGTALLAFVVWEGLQGRYSVASHASVLTVIGLTFLLAVAAGRGRQHESSRVWLLDAGRAPKKVTHGRWRTPAAAGAIAWTALITVTVAWDGVSFIEQKHSLPTLSRIFGAVTDHEWGRAFAFAAWLALGLCLALGRRRRTPEDAG